MPRNWTDKQRRHLEAVGYEASPSPTNPHVTRYTPHEDSGSGETPAGRDAAEPPAGPQAAAVSTDSPHRRALLRDRIDLVAECLMNADPGVPDPPPAGTLDPLTARRLFYREFADALLADWRIGVLDRRHLPARYLNPRRSQLNHQWIRISLPSDRDFDD